MLEAEEFKTSGQKVRTWLMKILVVWERGKEAKESSLRKGEGTKAGEEGR